MYISHRFMDQSDRLKIFIRFSKLITVTNSNVWPKPQTDSQVTVRSLFPTVLHYSAHTTESKSTRWIWRLQSTQQHAQFTVRWFRWQNHKKCICAVFDIRLQLVRLCWISLLSLHFMSLVDSPGCFCVFEPQQLYFFGHSRFMNIIKACVCCVCFGHLVIEESFRFFESPSVQSGHFIAQSKLPFDCRLVLSFVLALDLFFFFVISHTSSIHAQGKRLYVCRLVAFLFLVLNVLLLFIPWLLLNAQGKVLFDCRPIALLASHFESVSLF